MKDFAKILMPIALCGTVAMLAACGSDSLSSSASADSLPAGYCEVFSYYRDYKDFTHSVRCLKD